MQSMPEVSSSHHSHLTPSIRCCPALPHPTTNSSRTQPSGTDAHGSIWSKQPWHLLHERLKPPTWEGANLALQRLHTASVRTPAQSTNPVREAEEQDSHTACRNCAVQSSGQWDAPFPHCWLNAHQPRLLLCKC